MDQESYMVKRMQEYPRGGILGCSWTKKFERTLKNKFIQNFSNFLIICTPQNVKRWNGYPIFTEKYPTCDNTLELLLIDVGTIDNLEEDVWDINSLKSLKSTCTWIICNDLHEEPTMINGYSSLAMLMQNNIFYTPLVLPMAENPNVVLYQATPFELYAQALSYKMKHFTTVELDIETAPLWPELIYGMACIDIALVGSAKSIISSQIEAMLYAKSFEEMQTSLIAASQIENSLTPCLLDKKSKACLQNCKNYNFNHFDVMSQDFYISNLVKALINYLSEVNSCDVVVTVEDYNEKHYLQIRLPDRICIRTHKELRYSENFPKIIVVACSLLELSEHGIGLLGDFAKRNISPKIVVFRPLTDDLLSVSRNYQYTNNSYAAGLWAEMHILNNNPTHHCLLNLSICTRSHIACRKFYN